jgi:hypothetical protein
VSLGPIIRVGGRVRLIPRNRGDNEWPSRWVSAMQKRGTIVRTPESRGGRVRALVLWDGLKAMETVDPDALNYVNAHDGIYRIGERVRLRPTKSVGKVSAIIDWAGSAGVIVGTAGGDGLVSVLWDGASNRARVAFSEIEPE